MEIIIDKAIDKVNIVEIDVAIYLFIFIFKFNKKQTVLKINSIIIENKNYYGIYWIIFILAVRKLGIMLFNFWIMWVCERKKRKKYIHSTPQITAENLLNRNFTTKNINEK